MIILLLLISCRQERAVSPRLVELDSLIAVAPDSAAALLEAIPTDSLRNPENRAYHALLTTQAKYKAYLPFGDGALDTINMAVRYYSDGHDTERNTRSNLYKGCVFEELPQIDSAIYYYKAAEDLATQSGDTFQRGYILMRMASLFQSKYAIKEAIEYFRSALSCAQAIHNDYDALYVLQELANLYRTVKLDSAFVFSRQAINLSLQMDSAEFDYSLSTLASCYLIKKDYRQCASYARQSIGIATSNLTAFRSCHWAAQAYAQLGLIDSSAHFLQMSPMPINKADSVLYLSTKGLIDRDSVSLQKLSGDMADTLVCHEDVVKLEQAIKNSEIDRQQLFYVKQKHKQWLWISLVALFLSIVGAATYLLKHYKEKRQSDLIVSQRDYISRLGQILENEVTRSRRLQNELEQNKTYCQSLNLEIDRLSQAVAQKDAVAKTRDEQTEKQSHELCALRAEMERKQDTMSEILKQLAQHQDVLRDIVDRQKKLIMACYQEGCRKAGYNLQKLHSYMAECFTDDYCKNLTSSVRALYPRLDRVASEKEMTNRELMVICMHLAGFPNKIIREYLQVDRDHTVSNSKKSLAEKLLGKGSSLDDLKTPV